MRRLLVIGIGAGDPDHVTVQAIKAMNTATVFFVLSKGEVKRELVALREQILADHMTHDYRVVEIEDPPRDRTPSDYGRAVDDWHDARARLIADAFAATPDEAGAILVWGDPALYDSTLRILERVRELHEFDYEVIPGITSIAALAARHRVVLNRIGEPIRITTGRRVRDEPIGNTVVMLDGDCAFTELPDDVQIWWGAYLGMPDEVLVAGRLGDVRDELSATRARLRARKGWIMDTYLLRAPGPDGRAPQ